MCVGFSLAFVFASASRLGPPVASNIIVLIMSAVLLLFLVTGSAYVWTSVLIRRRSRPAAITALSVAVINALLLLAVPVIAGIVFIARGQMNAGGILGMIFYLSVALANAAAAFLLIRVLRETKSAAP